MTPELARLITVAELDYRHTIARETDKRYRSVHEAMHDSFLSDAALQLTWKAKVISDVNNPPQSLDEFEKRALERIKAGEREVWEQSANAARYFRGVRAVGGLCIECHRVLDQPRVPRENELVAAMSVELRPRKADE